MFSARSGPVCLFHMIHRLTCRKKDRHAFRCVPQYKPDNTEKADLKMMTKIFVILILFITYAAAQFDSGKYSRLYADYRLAPDDLMLMSPDFVANAIKNLGVRHPVLKIDEAGISVEERPIYHITFGSGKTKLLLWSQMHGDEPTATAALLAIFNFLGENTEDPFVSMVQDRLEIDALIMLNPDGAFRFQRRNAQDLDINRDARLLQSPEGRTLKRMKDLVAPDYAFNLHDMGGRETVGKSRKLLNIALMAPPFNENEEDSPSRIRAKKLIVILLKTLDPFIRGHMARYKADYMPRAFGDAMQNWGVSTILIESGMHDEADPHFLVKINFVALLGAFDVIARDRVDEADAAAYEQIPLEGPDLFDILIRDALIMNGSNIPSFRGDIGINIDHRLSGDSVVTSCRIADLGDLSITTGRAIIEGKNLVVTPGLIGSAGQGGEADHLFRAGYLVTSPEGPSFQTAEPEWIIPAEELPLYTSVPAEKMNMKKSGLIKRGMNAELLIFSDSDPAQLESENLIKLIHNGKIIELNPAK